MMSTQSDEYGAALRSAKARLSDELLRPSDRPSAFSAVRRIPTTAPRDNVQGVAIGHKVTDGRITGQLSVKIFVAKKFAPEHIPGSDHLPPFIDGVPTDIEETGLFRAQAMAPAVPALDPKEHRRPAQPGCSIGFEDPDHAFVMAGTFGAVVQRDGTQFVLSNNHVLANENRLPLGSAIFQPGLLDGGDPANDAIAHLTRFISLQTAAPNSVDCAIAEVISNDLVDPVVLGRSAPNGEAAAEHDMVVEKVGRTTGYSAGRISSIEADVKVDYEIGTLVFTNQILIVGLSGPFSAAGDSGSLITERDTHKAVGLLFAGSPTHTIANHLGDVLTALGVQLV